MPRMSKKRRLEWSFFLRQVKVGNSTCDRITYNDLCRGCIGKILLIDTQEGKIYYDGEIKERLAAQHPYRQWLNRDETFIAQ